MRALFDFFWNNFPSLKLILFLFPISIAWAFVALYIAAFLKSRYSWKTGYTRKVFHFLIFISAFIYQKLFALPGVFILGWAVTLVLGFAIFKDNGQPVYEALAREKDAPHRTKYIVYSYLATFVGGVFSNLFFKSFAVFGYAITGIGDAIAEPIGTAWGKHQYNVFSFDKNKKSVRSIEGSIGVFIASFTLLLLFAQQNLSISECLVVAIACTLTEALAPSGFDNLLLQIVASGLCFYFAKK